MSGNNKNEWNKFLNGGSPNYNFSYRQEKVEVAPTGTGITLAPMPPTASTAIPATKPDTNMNMRKRNNRTQKVEPPPLKDALVAAAGKNRGLKGGSKRRQRKTRRGHGRK